MMHGQPSIKIANLFKLTTLLFLTL